MNSNTPIEMAFHFLYTGLKGDEESAEKIAMKIAESGPREIFAFLMTLGGSIDAHSSHIEFEYPPYREYKEFFCAKLLKGSLLSHHYISERRE